MTELDVLRSDRVLSVVRAERIPDAADLCHALAAGGIRTVELTFTTPGCSTICGPVPTPSRGTGSCSASAR